MKKTKNIAMLLSVLGLFCFIDGKPVYAHSVIEGQSYDCDLTSSKNRPFINSLNNKKIDVLSATSLDICGLPELPKNYKMQIHQGVEYQILDLINQKRLENGLQPLTMDEGLVKLSRYKSADMLQYNYFSHRLDGHPYFGDVLTNNATGYDTSDLGENIYNEYGQTITLQAENIFNSWWNSESHRENMMNPKFLKVGIGVISNTDRTAAYATQIFSSNQEDQDSDTVVFSSHDYSQPYIPIKLTSTNNYTIGWNTINFKKYYSTNGVSLVKKQWLFIDNNWYYFDLNGMMKTGWFTDKDGKMYYLYNNGIMAHDTTIGGYKLGSSGAWSK